jgi:hypothetical protein
MPIFAARLSNGLAVKLEVMSILETGNKASAPIGIPKSLDSASEETAGKSKNGGHSRERAASIFVRSCIGYGRLDRSEENDGR